MKLPLKSVLRPTLARRVLLALLIAFSIVWVILLAVLYMQATSLAIHDKSVRDIGTGLISALSRLEEAGEAGAVAAATANQINDLYRINQVPAVVLIQVRDKSGVKLFSSVETSDAVLTGDAKQMTDAVIDGRPFRVFTGMTTRWTIVVAGSRASNLWLLKTLGRDLSLYMLIAFPFIFLAIWIAVSQGLRPLRELSHRITSRGADDLSVIDVDPKYAELKPFVLALNAQLAQLRNKIEREHTFIQDAAHELRTPMAVISAQAHVLAKAHNADERHEAERQLDHAIVRSSHLIQQLLQLARIDSARAQDVRSIDVAQFVRHELAQAVPTAMARKIDLSLEAQDSLPCSLDVHAFQSILHNLLGNALRYVQDGGQIVVELRATDSVLMLSIADDGPGIVESERAMVFERFYRGKGHDVSGSGLGLSIVKQAAIKLNGTVQLSSGLGGRGCRFLVEIPFVGFGSINGNS